MIDVQKIRDGELDALTTASEALGYKSLAKMTISLMEKHGCSPLEVASYLADEYESKQDELDMMFNAIEDFKKCIERDEHDAALNKILTVKPDFDKIAFKSSVDALCNELTDAEFAFAKKRLAIREKYESRFIALVEGKKPRKASEPSIAISRISIAGKITYVKSYSDALRVLCEHLNNDDAIDFNCIVEYEWDASSNKKYPSITKEVHNLQPSTLNSKSFIKIGDFYIDKRGNARELEKRIKKIASIFNVNVELS